jgi:hypothetical protein
MLMSEYNAEGENPAARYIIDTKYHGETCFYSIFF